MIENQETEKRRNDVGDGNYNKSSGKDYVLSGRRRKQLQEALVSAFPTKASLEQMLLYGLDKNLEAIAGLGTLQEIIFNIIQKAEAEGWIPNLIRAAQQSNSGNPKLKAINFTEIINSEVDVEAIGISLKPRDENHPDDKPKNNSPVLPPKQVQENSVGKKIDENHKYNGKLSTFEIEFYEIIPSKKIKTKLSISFGTVEVKIPKKKKILERTNQTIDIKFGLKNCELYLYLTNGSMSLKERNILINQDYNWKGNPTGTPECPIWEFKLNNESKIENESKILYGLLKNEVLGVLELLEANTYCELKAVVKISVNRNYIAIINLDDGTNKKQRETKIGLLLQYLETELEDYISQAIIKYETALIS